MIKYPIQYKNVVKWSKGKSERKEHKDMKSLICRILSDYHLDYATEVEFTNKSRADIIILKYKIVIEVLNTESVLKFKKKNFPLITIPVSIKVCEEQIISMIEDIIATNGTGAEYYVRNILI